MRIARYGAQEVKTCFFEKTSRSEVALENFGLNLGQAERAKSIACDQMRGGGADTLAPVGTSDDYPELCDTLLFGCDSQPDRSHAIGRALRYDRPSNTCLLAKPLSMTLKPLKAHFDRLRKRIPSQHSGFRVRRTLEPCRHVVFREFA